MIPFDDIHLPGGLSLSLKCALGATTINRGVDMLDENGVEELLETDLWYEYGKVVWFRFSDNGEDHFFNFLPGEYRDSPPDGPDDMIRNWKRPLKTGLTKMEKFLDFAESVSPEGITQDMADQIRMLRKRVGPNGKEIFIDASGFYETAKRIQQADSQEVVGQLFDELFKKYYYTYAMQLAHFSACITLLKLQLRLGMFIKVNAYSIPEPHINELIWQAKKRSPDLLHLLTDIGNDFYDKATANLNKAIKDYGVEDAMQLTRIAAHQFYGAKLIAQGAINSDIKLDLKYNALVAEEGWACAVTGFSNKQFFFNKPDFFPKLIAQGLLIHGSDFIYKFIRTHSTPTKPYFPRLTVKILIAYGKVLAGGHYLSEGVEELKALENDTGTSLFDLCLVEHFLLKSTMKTGDEEMRMRYAFKLAARTVLSKF